jgi:hypothetical protein
MLTVELGYTQEWQAPHNANSGSQYASFHRDVWFGWCVASSATVPKKKKT